MKTLNISTSVRPARVAVLVDVNDAHWQHTCLRVIEYFTRIWGGCANIIVPTDGNSITPLFWEVLERFDPDYLQAYSRTMRDVEIEQPEQFEAAYKKYIESWESQTKEPVQSYAAESIRENLRNERISKFEISEQLQEQLKQRIAPFYLNQWIVEAGAVWADSTPSHPLTDIVDILPNIDHGSHILKLSPSVSDVPPPVAGRNHRCNNHRLAL